jgi:hypothetical protein
MPKISVINGVVQESPEGAWSLHSVVAALEASGLVTHSLSEGETKFMGVCQLAPGSTHRQGVRERDIIFYQSCGSGEKKKAEIFFVSFFIKIAIY